MLAAAMVFFSSCSDDDDEPGNGAELSISPEGPLNFKAIDDKTYEITVTTNQDSWKVVPSKGWVIITKGDNKFVVSVGQNLTTEKQSAVITVSAGKATDKTIVVNQEAGTGAGPGGDDTGLTIWEDTHWRWMQLKGNPKKMTYGENVFEFNANGKMVREYVENSEEYKYDYDSQGRIIKFTYTDLYEDNPSPEKNRSFISKKRKTNRNIISRAGIRESSVPKVVDLKYGNHEKYVPMFELADEMYMLKGLTGMSINGQDMITLSIENDKIKTSFNDEESHNDVTISYSGNYPVNQELIETYEDETNSPESEKDKAGVKNETKTFTYINITDYTYGVNYKFAKIDNKYKDSEDPDWYSDYIKYINTGIYLLPEEDSENYGGEHTIKYEYNAKGQLVKVIAPYDQIYTYKNYKEDSHGNWIERSVYQNEDTEPKIETRTIEYY